MKNLAIAFTCITFAVAAARGAEAPAAPAPAAEARDAATNRFNQSAEGKALLAKVRAAEARRDRVRASRPVEERTEAARALLDARGDYAAALKKALDADAAYQAAAKTTSRPAEPKPTAGAADSKPAEQPADPAPMNATILDFARKNLGKQVGNGECWTLADKALKLAGAQAPDTYVWGRPLGPKEAILPGDVIQFTTVRLEKDGGFQGLGNPQHTAIVAKVLSPTELVILHQNYGVKTVTELTIDISTKTAGELVIYRPLPGAGYKGAP